MAIPRLEKAVVVEPEIVVVGVAGDLQEDHARPPSRNLEAEDVTVELRAAVDVGHPQHHMLHSGRANGHGRSKLKS